LKEQEAELAEIVTNAFLKYVQDGIKADVWMKCSLGPPESAPKWFPWRSQNDLCMFANRIDERVNRALDEIGLGGEKFWINAYGPEVQNDGVTDIWIDWKLVVYR